MRASRNNLFFAFLVGGLIGLIIRRRREQKQAAAASRQPSRRDHSELTARWRNNFPNSIG